MITLTSQTTNTPGVKPFRKQRSCKDYTHPDDYTRQTTDTPGFNPFARYELSGYEYTYEVISWTDHCLIFSLLFCQVISAQQLPKPAGTKGEVRTKGEARKEDCNMKLSFPY